MGFRTVFIKNGERLGLRLDNLEIDKEGEKFRVPLMDIENIVLEGDRTVITTRILAKLAQYHIGVIVCDKTYTPCGQFLELGQYHRSAKRAIWQSNWTELQKKNIWMEIIRQKIENQIAVASVLQVGEERIQLMQELKEGIMLGDESNREGHVAKVYFNSVFGQGFSRNDNVFPNHCLDYGYSIIRAQVARSALAVGLLPMLGVFHKNEYNSFNLVDDLMEPFRPLMDWYIFRKILSKNQEFLTYENRLLLIDFLNQQIVSHKKKVYINQVIIDYINSFIKCMEQEDYDNLLPICLSNFMECVKDEV